MKQSSEALRKKAERCRDCPICSRARRRQKGLAYLFTKYVDRKICPNCRAFEQVTGQRACEPITDQALGRIAGEDR